MSLLPKVEENVAKRVAVTIDRMRSHTLTNLINTSKELFQLLWHHPEKSPQEILDEFGTSAAIIFNDHAATVKCILSIDPTALVPEDYTPPLSYTINPDGTVTIQEVVESQTVTKKRKR